MKRRIAIALLVTAACVAGASAAPPPINGGLVGTGVLIHGTTVVALSSTRGVVMEWAAFQPGASSGWHFHRTAVAVSVTSGTLTLYDSSDPSCKPVRYSKGHGFVEPPNHVHIAINQGTTTAKLALTYIGVPGKWRTNPMPLDVGAKNPGNCPASIK